MHIYGSAQKGVKFWLLIELAESNEAKPVGSSAKLVTWRLRAGQLSWSLCGFCFMYKWFFCENWRNDNNDVRQHNYQCIQHVHVLGDLREPQQKK